MTARWRSGGFLKNTTLLPAAFKDIRIDIDYGHRFAYTSKRLRYAYTPALQKIEPDSMLTLRLRLTDRGKVVWDVAACGRRQRADKTRAISRAWWQPDDLNDNFKSNWNKIVNRQRPFDGAPRSENDVMKISSVIAGADKAKPTVLYTVYHYAEGAHSPAEMKAEWSAAEGRARQRALRLPGRRGAVAAGAFAPATLV